MTIINGEVLKGHEEESYQRDIGQASVRQMNL
jgi:hypothetical protein